MRGSEIVKYALIGALVILLQVLLFKQFEFGWERFNYVQFIIYPIFILILPLRISRAPLVIIGFVLGFIIDLFYGSPGVHTSATVFIAFARPYVLNYLEPRGGYNVDDTPISAGVGLTWYLSYTSILMFAHLLFYFSVEVFTFYYMLEIWMKTFFSFVFSMLIIIMHGILAGAVKFR